MSTPRTTDTAIKQAATPAPAHGHPLWPIPDSAETEPGRVERALRERIKELNCLYAISRVAERHPHTLEGFLHDVVKLLPLSWQFPGITCARILFRGACYQTDSYRASPWCQSAPIRVHGQEAGTVHVAYLEPCEEAFEGPFLREERALLDAVAERIGAVAARKDMEAELQESNRQLSVERQALQESNIALRGVLARIEEEKQAGFRDIQSNVERILMPIIHALMLGVPKPHRAYVDLLRKNLAEITSPFVNQLTRTYATLTPTEVHICDMIRRGMRTKEIARIRGISSATVSRHREHIRRKLGLANNPVNLTMFLQTTTAAPQPANTARM